MPTPRPAAAVMLWLAGVAPALAAGAADSGPGWSLLLPDIAVTLAGLGWLVLMIRRRG